MADYIQYGNEKHYFLNPHPENSRNGLYLIRMGETFPSSDYYIERYGKTRLASLGGVFVLEYVIGGEGYIECGGNTYHVAEGDFYFLNRGFPHRYYSEKKNPLHKIWINCAGPFIAGVVAALGITDGVWISHFDAEAYFRRVQSLLSASYPRNRDKLYDQVALILTELLLTAASSQRSLDDGKEDLIYEIRRFMDSEVNLRTSLDEICALFYQNKSYLIYRFRRTFGITPHQYLLRRKMEAAREMLATGGVQIKEISGLLGFSNPQYFSTAFRAACGMTPLEYREKARREQHREEEKPSPDEKGPKEC
ncbi:MAG: AraC family transcriptional regulator [Clostridia bacterium]|nr:AraC family transcriptional regulator [Clostridia bacterium]